MWSSCVSVEDLQHALEIKAGTAAAQYLDSILGSYDAGIKEVEHWAPSAEGKSAFEGFAGVLAVVAGRVLKAAGMAKSLGRDWESDALALHDDLLAFANKSSELGHDVAAKGGQGNLYTRLHGPPEWHLAVDLAALYQTLKPRPKGTRDEFVAAVYTPAVEHVRGGVVGRNQLGSRHAREAYKITWRALPITNRICDISDQLRSSKKIKTRERKALQHELATLQEHLSQIRDKAPYPFLIGRQPGT
jgi:hypothetical protein